MAKLLSDMRIGVRVYLDESDAQDFTDAEVDLAINYAYQNVAMEVIKVHEEYYSTTTPFTYAIVKNQQEYTVDPTLIKITRVEINFNPTDANSKAVRALPVKKDEILTNLAFNNTSTSFFNAGYYLHGDIGSQKIGFIPIPSIADTTGKSISVWGIAIPTNLTAATDTVNIPWADNFGQIIELRATSRLLSKGQQAENESSKYYKMYKEEVSNMRVFLKERQEDSIVMIQDSQLEDIDFTSMGFS